MRTSQNSRGSFQRRSLCFTDNLSHRWHTTASVDISAAVVEGGVPLWRVVPDCSHTAATDWLRFARWLDVALDRCLAGVRPAVRSACVVGIRTGGSYLGPLVTAVLQAKDVEATFTTVRLIRQSWAGLQRTTVPEDYVSGELMSIDYADMVIIVDDLIGSGQTAGALRKAIRALPGHQPQIGIVCLAEFGKSVVERLLGEQGFDSVCGQR